MTNRSFTPTQITLAMVDIPAMVAFYASLFDLDFQPVSLADTTLYRATLDDVAFVLCPNSLAGVEAQQSRHQFAYSVADLPATIERACTVGGVFYEQYAASNRPTGAVVRDPDGNSIVFVAASK